MIKKIRAILFSSLTALTLLVPAVATPVIIHADETINEGLCQGANLEVGSTCTELNEEDAEEGINSIITTVINIFSIVVGLIAVIMIIIGGIRFVMSGGDSAATTSARNTILYAIVGLVVVALAQIIVRFVLQKTQPIQ
jgi:hypothetical protein